MIQGASRQGCPVWSHSSREPAPSCVPPSLGTCGLLCGLTRRTCLPAVTWDFSCPPECLLLCFPRAHCVLSCEPSRLGRGHLGLYKQMPASAQPQNSGGRKRETRRLPTPTLYQPSLLPVASVAWAPWRRDAGSAVTHPGPSMGTPRPHQASAPSCSPHILHPPFRLLLSCPLRKPPVPAQLAGRRLPAHCPPGPRGPQNGAYRSTSAAVCRLPSQGRLSLLYQEQDAHLWSCSLALFPVARQHCLCSRPSPGPQAAGIWLCCAPEAACAPFWWPAPPLPGVLPGLTPHPHTGPAPPQVLPLMKLVPEPHWIVSGNAAQTGLTLPSPSTLGDTHAKMGVELGEGAEKAPGRPPDSVVQDALPCGQVAFR